MTPAALVLMVITILIIWGGLIASIVALRTLPSPDPLPSPDNFDRDTEDPLVDGLL